MGPLTSLVLLVLLMAVLFYVLFLVVRTAVKEGMQMALHRDLLDQPALDDTDASS